jgi:hypothetical protein
MLTSCPALTLPRFAWSWTRLDTYTLREDAPKIRLRNGYALVELCEVLFSTFYPYLALPKFSSELSVRTELAEPNRQFSYGSGSGSGSSSQF